MNDEYEVIWTGDGALIEGADRDYAAMRGDGWDLFYVPPSPLTTPWDDYQQWARPDPEQHVRTSMERRGPRRKALRILKDWTREYTGDIAQQGRHR